jgi:diguanylate cyclase (GGDEF) domain
MDENNSLLLQQLLQTAPGGIAKLALDDILTILNATDTFYTLIKNVSDKAVSRTSQALLRIVYSADIISVTQQLAGQKHRSDDMLNIHFRTLQQDGSFRWVMITGKKTGEMYTSGIKTVPVYSCVAMDITELMTSYKKVEQSNDYFIKITELSRDLFFEYEIASDTLSFTELFREVFGKDNIMQGFRKRLEKTKVIHSEELPAVVSIFNSMMSGRKQARFELRLISKEGTPVWYICYASIIFDENRTPYKVVGKLSAINKTTQEADKPKHVPHMDSLTNIYSKESAEILITEMMTKQEEGSLSALFLIDLRNYKNINEVRKSINGESILTQVGALLKNQFRTSDIVGRIGLNEFVVFMRDIVSDKMAYDQADTLCRIIEAIYSYEHTKSGITVSIGIALQKGPQEYQAVLANANTALVMAKKVTTSSFEIFADAVS